MFVVVTLTAVEIFSTGTGFGLFTASIRNAGGPVSGRYAMPARATEATPMARIRALKEIVQPFGARIFGFWRGFGEGAGLNKPCD